VQSVPAQPVPSAPAARAEPAIAGLRLGSRCARVSSSGRVRVALSMRLAQPGPVHVRIERAVGSKALRKCPRPSSGRRFTGRFRTVATLKRAPTRSAAAAAVPRRVTLNLRLAPAYYRITVRAYLDADRLSRPVRANLRVLRR